VAALLQDALDEGMLAEPGGTHEVEVVTPVGDAHPEVDGLHRPLLAQAGAQGFKLTRVGEVETGEVAGMVKIGGAQADARFHGF
jgi:hypothetical protein